MFLINGKPLSKQEHPEQHKWLEAKKKEILETDKKAYYFKAFKRQAYVVDEYGKNRKVKQKRGVSVSSVLIDPKGGLTTHDTWSYIKSLNACKSVGDGSYSVLRKTMFVGNEEVYTVQDDLEIIVFLKYMSKNKNVSEIDHQAISRNKAEMKALESQVNFYIFNERSPIHPSQTGSEKQLRNIAMAWMVPGAETSDIYTVMNVLWDVVQFNNKNSKAGADGRGYKQFCEDAASTGNSEDRSAIVTAIKRKSLFYDEESNSWKLKIKGGLEQFLCGVPLGNKDKEEHVIKYVLSDESYIDSVKESLDFVPNPSADYSKLSRDELIKEVAKLGWPEGPLHKTSSAILLERLEKKLVPTE